MQTRCHDNKMDAFRKGDEKAFSSIYDIYYGPLYYYTLRILGNSGEAQEITADCFMKLWKLKENFETLHNVKSFLYITARNASLNVLKQKKEYARRNEEMGYLLMQDMDGPSMQDEVRSDVLTTVLSEIEKLPKQCRKILEFSFINGWKNSQIADKLGLTLQTVKNQKTRGIKMLKDALASKVAMFFIAFYNFLFGLISL
jgi:RNA polymerase sigma-70 factor (family 1)